MTSQTEKPRIVLDCDPGLDDAFAIFTASRYAQVEAITSVNGNVNIDLTTRNALIVSQVAGMDDCPVYRGAARPLVVDPGDAAEVHGDSGLDGPVLPELTKAIEHKDAVEALLDVTADGDVTVVPVGPLTNIALAIQRDPGFATRVPEIVLMGASNTGGNVTACAEFNIWADPHAAQIVFDSGARIRALSLDITHQVLMGKEEEEALRASGTATATFGADLLNYYGDFHERIFGSRSGAMHDPVAVIAVTHPHLFHHTMRHVAVETESALTRGLTVVDERPTTEPPNVGWVDEVQSKEVVDLIMAAAIDPVG